MKICQIKEIQKNEVDCGSTQVQIYHLTVQINKINEHLKLYSKDNAAKRGLLVLLGKRNRLCKYFKRRNPELYTDVIIDKIGLRK